MLTLTNEDVDALRADLDALPEPPDDDTQEIVVEPHPGPAEPWDDGEQGTAAEFDTAGRLHLTAAEWDVFDWLVSKDLIADVTRTGSPSEVWTPRSVDDLRAMQVPYGTPKVRTGDGTGRVEFRASVFGGTWIPLSGAFLHTTPSEF